MLLGIAILQRDIIDQRAAHETNGAGHEYPRAKDGAMASLRNRGSMRRDPALAQATLALTAAFWIGNFILNSTRSEVLGQSQGISSYGTRLLLNLAGVAICWGGQWLIIRRRAANFYYRLVLVVALALIGAIAYAALSTMAPLVILDDQASGHVFTAFILSLNYWAWFFLAWAGMLLGLIYSYEAIERERQLNEALMASHLAKIQALRYQVNPHFLFNTLNAIASWVPHGTKAERLILDLADFFRMTLSIDPVADIRLDREFDIQMLYLNIEQARYGDRLSLAVDLDDAARNVLVPSLILQPLVENAIKYGLSSSRAAVRIGLSASIVMNGDVEIRVSDDGRNATRKPVGTGTGLQNVAQRLESRFGSAAKMHAGPGDDGGFDVVIMLERPDRAP